MSLHILAPTDKSEHLIYSIFPVSLSYWIVSQLSITDPIMALGTVVSLSSFGILVLYELTPEQWIVNMLLRFITQRRSSLSEAILIFSALVRIWKHDPTSLEDNHLKNKGNLQVSNVVSGPFIKKRSWRIRGSLYLILSLWFIMSATWKFLTDYGSVLSNEFIDYYTSNVGIIFIGTLLAFVVVFIARHRKLPSHIDHLARFEYLNNLLAERKLRNSDSIPEELSTNHPESPVLNFEILSKELEIVNEKLANEDWSGFIQRWDNIYHWIHRGVVGFIGQYFLFDLMEPFTHVYSKIGEQNRQGSRDQILTDTIEDAKRKLQWVSYFVKMFNKALKQPRSDDLAKKLPLPVFDKDFIRMAKWIDEHPECIEDIDAYLDQLTKFDVIEDSGASAVVVRVLAFLKDSSANSLHIQKAVERGMLVLNEELVESTFSIDPALITKVILLAYREGGIGLEYELIRDYRALKTMYGLKKTMPYEFNKALVRFIRKAHGEQIGPLLKDHSFLAPLLAMKEVHEALHETRARFAGNKEYEEMFDEVEKARGPDLS